MARLYNKESDLITIRQIPCIAKPGNDIFMLVQNGVDGGTPQRDVVQRTEKFHQIVNACLCGDDAAEMQVLWNAFGT